MKQCWMESIRYIMEKNHDTNNSYYAAIVGELSHIGRS